MSDVPNATYRRLLDPDGFLMKSNDLLESLCPGDRPAFRALVMANSETRQAFVRSVSTGCAGDDEIDELHDMITAHYEQEKEVAANLQAARAAIVVPAAVSPPNYVDLTYDSD